MQSPGLANGPERRTDWDTVDWRRSHRIVRNLRSRIFRATREGDIKKVRSLQKLMLRSYSNILLSVRRVTQANAGKNTPGVDKIVVKTPRARGELVDHLTTFQPWRARPVRRVYIPKTDGSKRPLGIPMARAYRTPYLKPWGWNSCRLPGAALVHALLAASSPARQHTWRRSLRRPLFPATPHRLPQALDTLRCQS